MAQHKSRETQAQVLIQVLLTLCIHPVGQTFYVICNASIIEIQMTSVAF